MNSNILLLLTGIGVLGMACQLLAWWTRLPAILFLLLTGILFGPVTGILKPDLIFGELLFPAVSLSVAIILFEGSLTLKFEDIKGLGSVVRNLITVGAGVSWAVTTAVTHYLLSFPLEMACLFGAVVIVTGPTVIIPMLRTVRPNSKIANVLKWEGITIDPLGALLAVLVFEFIISSQSGHAFNNIFYSFSELVITGIVTGILSALLFGFVIRRDFVPEYLRNIFALIVVCAVFTVSDLIAHESGLLSVTIMGIALANMKDTNIEDILDFKESLSVLLISTLFIVLAARIEISDFNLLGWNAVAVLLIMMFIARPLGVFVSAFGSDLKLNEKLLISWIGPRGIVAAAIASIFALRLEKINYPEASLLVPLTFLIIIGTVVIQSATAKILAGLLKVREPPPTGVLIIGAGNVARSIGKSIQEQGFKVMLTDSNWENISLARMDGLQTYYGNPVSEHAERNLDLVGLGKMLAMSGRSHLDSLASLKFRADFGDKNVYELKSTTEKHGTEKHSISTKHRGYQLFGADITHGTVATWLRNGAEIRSTQLSEEFDFDAYMAKYAGSVIPMYSVDNKNRLQFMVMDGEIKPEPGWTLTGLIKRDALKKNNT